MTALEEIKKALTAAEQFIVNGVELGYIRMPNPETPDSAHDTLPMIRQAQTALESLQRENEELRKKADEREDELVAMLNSADESRVAQIRRAEVAEAEVKRLTESRDGYKRGRDSIQSEYDRLRASNSAEVETLTDKIEGLSADLDSAVGVAFNRGAHEWVRMNYPDRFEELSRTALASTGGKHHAE